MKILATKIQAKNLRFFDVFYNKPSKEFYVVLWFWLIIFYKDDVN